MIRRSLLLLVLVVVAVRTALAVERLPSTRPLRNEVRMRVAQNEADPAPPVPPVEPQPGTTSREKPPRPEPLPQPDGPQNPPLQSPSDAMRLPPRGPEEVKIGGAITIGELQDMALANNPTLLQAQAAVQAAQGNWEQVGLYPNPTFAYMATQIGDRATPGQQGGYIEQQFVRGRKLPLNRSVASREVAIEQRNFAAQRMRVFNDVRIYFYHTLVAQRMLEISTELVRIGEQALRAANELLDAKEVSRVDVLQARIEVNAAKIGLVNSQNRYQAAWRKLVSVTGVPGMAEARVEGDLVNDMPTFTWEESMGRILTESPELASTRIGVDRALWALRRARVEPVPNVLVQAGPQYDLGGHQTISNVNIALPVPIFNYNQGNIRKAEAELRSARAEVSRKELELTTRLAAAFERYSNARNQVQQYREQILPDAREALNLVTAGYRQGELGFLVLLTAQRTYFYTNLAYLDAQRDLWETALTIDGLLLTDSLQAGGGSFGATSGATSTPPSMFPFMGK